MEYEMVAGAGRDKYPGLNQYSVNSMEAMGYTEQQIVSSLNYLKAEKKYTPIGEVDRAIEYISK
jgi:hypothetical protein